MQDRNDQDTSDCSSTDSSFTQCAGGIERHAEPRRTKLAIASLMCSLPPVAVGLWAFKLYWFGVSDGATGDDILEAGIVTFRIMPLTILGLGLGAFARGFRPLCIVAGLLPILCWSSIIITEGGIEFPTLAGSN